MWKLAKLLKGVSIKPDGTSHRCYVYAGSSRTYAYRVTCLRYKERESLIRAYCILNTHPRRKRYDKIKLHKQCIYLSYRIDGRLAHYLEQQRGKLTK